jgi:predicted ATP-grasp superfamily ATP-dependent carboligase
MYETGLAVARSLGRAGIRVYGVDFKPDIGFRSRFVEPAICPNPLEDTDAFLLYLERLAYRFDVKPVVFIASDDFLLSVSRARSRLARSCLLLLPPEIVVEAIEDKLAQAQLAARAGVRVPETFCGADLTSRREIEAVPLPAILKGRHVTGWRRAVGVQVKGFLVRSHDELAERLEQTEGYGVDTLVQELIPGPDTSHFKVSALISSQRELLSVFCLRKIRQCPPGSGFGCLVESHSDPHLLATGLALFNATGYIGVGSAEFKFDSRDGHLKLIELNPRYWQQVALAERCGVNFPLQHYLDAIGLNPRATQAYLTGVKWQNLHRDIDSFRVYHERGELSISQWLRSLRGPIMNSCYATDDVVPGLIGLTSEPLRRVRARFRKLVSGQPVPHGP